MTSAPPAIVWLRQDLRLADNPALFEAAAKGPIIPIFILDDAAAGEWTYGGASRWWLHHSVGALGRDFAARGVPLVLRRGDSQKILDDVVAHTGATAVYWNRRYEPWAIAQDTKIKESLKARGIAVHSSNGKLLTEPWDIKPYRVFTPFWKACLEQFKTNPVPFPLPAPKNMIAGPTIASDTLDHWGLLPTKPDWAGGLRTAWGGTIGEAGGQTRFQNFLKDAVTDYSARRDFPSMEKTSRLSPHLAFGEISARQIWHVTHAALHAGKIPASADKAAEHFLREVGWREFSYHLLYHIPTLTHAPLQPKFANFPWDKNDTAFTAWTRGRTGYPIIDAGMRQLWETGWMHNRVRMVVGSFLVKDLLLDWRGGMEWFWDTLVDADLANNTCSWQWVAGCGADAAPYFRIFNPILQSQKFEAADYIRRYVPELRPFPDDAIHEPKNGYIPPIIDRAEARGRALAALAQTKE